MSALLRLEDVHAQSRPFMRHHRLTAPAPGSELTLGEPRGEGAFGVVHPVEAIDGRTPARPLLAKVFIPEALQASGGPGEIIARAGALQRALERQAEPSWPEALLALPFVVASGTLAGRVELVTLMLDLRPLGYEAIELGNKKASVAYRRRPARERTDFAVRFAERVALLEAISFVHGDLNPENLLFDSAGHDVQIIDLDAGAVVESGRERPLAGGKRDACVPPEVKRPDSRDPIDIDRFTAAAERWSVGSLVGMILFGVHPGFFLKAISTRTLDAYARSGRRWPLIDAGSAEFVDSPAAAAAYEKPFKARFEAAPGGTRELFSRLFEAGSDGDRRPRAGDWLEGLREACEPPVFEFVRVDSSVVPEAGEVLVSWATRDAEGVESPQLGTLAPSGSARFVVERSMRFALTAFNPYGRSQMSSPVVRVVPLPRIRSIPIRDFPRFSVSSRFVIPAPQLPMPTVTPPRFAARVGLPRHSPAPLTRHLPAALPLPPLPHVNALLGPFFPDLEALREAELR